MIESPLSPSSLDLLKSPFPPVAFHLFFLFCFCIYFLFSFVFGFPAGFLFPPSVFLIMPVLAGGDFGALDGGFLPCVT